MKITEIIDTEFIDSKQISANSTSNADTHLGMGKSAFVTQNDNIPFEVDKHNFSQFPDSKNNYSKKDPYMVWIEAIAPYAKSNPYLPRVSVADYNSNDEGYTKPSYKIERLVNPADVDFNVLLALYEKECSSDDNYIKSLLTKNEEVAKKEIWFTIVDQVLFNVHWDDHIDQVLTIIEQLVNSSNMIVQDTHEENFMIRMTSIGPQIVFTDPISYKK